MTPKQQMLELIRELRIKRYEKTLIYKVIHSIPEGKKGENHQLSPSNDNHKGKQ